MQAGDINVAGGLVLDISRQEEPVTIAGKSYVMREWLGSDKLKYDADRTEGMDVVVEADRKVLRNAKRLGGNEALLVSLCLHEKCADGAERRVSEAFVQGLPGHAQTKLYELAQRVCRLSETDSLAGLKKDRDALEAKIANLERQPDPKG